MINKTIAIISYIAVIVAANSLTERFGLVSVFGILTVTAGTFAAGLALVLRDAVQVTSGKTVALLAIAVGVAISYFTSTPALAVASGTAFAASELVDMAVFTPLRPRNIYLAVIAASIVASPVDTVLFLHIAGFPLTVEAIVGQFIIKTAMAILAVATISIYRNINQKP